MKTYLTERSMVTIFNICYQFLKFINYSAAWQFVRGLKWVTSCLEVRRSQNSNSAKTSNSFFRLGSRFLDKWPFSSLFVHSTTTEYQTVSEFYKYIHAGCRMHFAFIVAKLYPNPKISYFYERKGEKKQNISSLFKTLKC